ncbi:VirB4 family type IV secretion system protein [Ectobacillus funiculus]|uniref:VirB4 family type IV secretion system protein n=1 Tax=Ectobacillus funiculus TaxID=137993 RepID=A0ABV5W9D3_9BACI
MKKKKNLFSLMLKPKINKPSFFKRLKGQKFINVPVKRFENDVIRTTDEKYKTVIKVTDPVNLDLLDEVGTLKVVGRIRAALNTHVTGQKCQILVSSDAVDIQGYIEELDMKADSTDNVFKKSVVKGTQEYLSDYTLKSRNIHNFFIVLESDEKDYEEALKTLYDLTKNVIENLKAGGMNARRTSEEEIKELVYNKLAPNTKLTQPYENGMDLTAWQPPDMVQGKYLEMDNMHYAFYTISYFPKEVEAGWLDGIMNARVNLDISISLHSTDKGDQIDKIDRQIRDLNTRLLNKLPSSLRRKYEDEIKSLERLLDRMQDDSENLFDNTFILTIREEDQDKLNSACKRLESAVKTNRLKAKRIPNNVNCFWYSLPLGYYNGDIEQRYSWPMYAELIASMVPFNSAELNENTGLFMGLNVKSESPVVYNAWDESKYNNLNEVILGEPGSGKSTYVKTKIFREYSFGKVKRQFIIDPEREYHVLPGSNHIIFKPGSRFVTNPFHIRSTIVDADDPAQESTRIIDYLPKKISEMITFFKWIVPEMTSLEQSTLLECITEAYAKFGLMLHEDIVDLPDTFPTLSTLDAIMQKTPGMERVKATLRPFVNGVYSGIFNGQTNWTLNAEINVLDINELDESIRKPLMDLLLKDLWEEAKKDRNEKVGLYADELWILADERNPQAMYFMFSMAKRIRKYGGFLCVATQNVADFISVGRYGTALINNAQIKTFMRLSKNDIKELEDNFETFSDGEREILSGNKPRGYCLHIVKTKHVEMRTVITPEEQASMKLKPSYGEHQLEEVVV